MNIIAPGIQLLDDILKKSFSMSASDIHLEPSKLHLKIRYRIDGILYKQNDIDQIYGLQVISRIKVLANMNVAEKRIPQDGKFCYQYFEREIDLRIATFPSLYGEKIVIRILDHNEHGLNIESLGFNKNILEKIKKISNYSSGFFLVTGPTGSGKTTTLHSMLKLINTPAKNITTLEDPIEYNITGITQSQVYPEIGFNFEKGIRSILRQDPDVIMVGEIRDHETAQVAIQAALTGHLVLSTLHTNDAPGGLLRLLDMKIESFLINSSLTGILTQRLARKLCMFCKQTTNLNQEEEIFINNLNLPINKIYKSTGCKECFGLGYKGRIGIFELMMITTGLRTLINNKPNFQQIFEQACKDGMKSLIEDATDKVNQGIISLSELARILC